MSDFLAFLNSADAETLTKTPGISPTLAESIISARPFESADDCLQVHGMGKALLARLQSTFEAAGQASEGRGLQPVEEDAAPAIVVTSPPAGESASQPGPSFGSRLGALGLSLVRGLVRLLALIIILGAIVALIYYGAPAIRSYLMGPVEQNRVEIVQLRSELQTMQDQVTDLQTQLAQANSRVDALEQSIASHTASLAKLEEMQAALEKNVESGAAKLTAELTREIALTRSIEYLSRARLYLSQSNFGLARNDVQAARDLLAETQASNSDFKTDAISQVLMRLDLALGNLPAFPVIAVSDVDIALELLLSGLPEGAAAPTATSVIEWTPTMVPTEVATSTPTPLPPAP